jgi:hypothetical protein
MVSISGIRLSHCSSPQRVLLVDIRIVVNQQRLSTLRQQSQLMLFRLLMFLLLL